VTPAPNAAEQARAQVPLLEEELRQATLHYEAAYSRLIHSRTGSKEARVWQSHTSRHRNDITRLVTRLNRARATAEGRAWLRAV
jgi:hypothetical protein